MNKRIIKLIEDIKRNVKNLELAMDPVTSNWMTHPNIRFQKEVSNAGPGIVFDNSVLFVNGD